MTHPLGPIRLIVNPHAGRGKVAEQLADIRRVLDANDLAHDVVQTEGPGHATALAVEALDEDERDFLVAVGGDGTVQEVVNGMLHPDGTPRREKACLGIVSAGSGGDFVRTFGLNRPPERVVRHLANHSMLPTDVGVVECTGTDGQPLRRFFINIAEVGYGALAVERANRLPRRLGRVRYLLGAYWAIRALDRQECEVTVDHGSARHAVVNVVVANGQFFGGGMKVAPRALTDDGRFNAQIFSGPRSQVFVMTRAIYRGEHLPHPDIAEYQTSVVELAPEIPMLIEADGEVLGTTPAAFSIIPRALRLKV